MFQRRRALTQVQVIAIVVIVVIAGVGLYLEMRQGQLEVTPTPSTPTPSPPTPTPTPPPTPTPSPTHSITPLPALVQPGATKTQNFMFQGFNRTVIVHLSKIYDPQKPQPLVFFFHGGGETPQEKAYGGFSTKVDQSGGIAVYPGGYWEGSYTQSTWYTSFGIPETNPKGINDEAFVLEIIYRLKQQYNIDQNRIYATGHSMGGFMSYDLGAVLSDVFAAIAPQGASIGVRYDDPSAPLHMIPEPKGPVSVIAFHGTEDAYVDYYGKPLKNTYVSQAESTAFWVRVDGCITTPKNVTSSNIVYALYSGVKEGTEVALVTYVGGDHGYSADAIDKAWDFFMSHPKIH